MRGSLLPALLLPLLPLAASAAASGGTASAPHPPAEAKVVYGARLYLPGFAISPRSYSKSWTASGSVGTGEATGTGTEADPFVLPFSLNVGSGSSAARLSGTGRFHVAPGGAMAADWTAVADRDGTMAEAFVGATIQASDIAGGSIHLDGKPLAIPREKSKTGRLAERRVSRVAAIAQDGRTILDVAFDAPTDVLVQDDRFYGYADIALRFFFATGRVEKGREYAVSATFSTTGFGAVASAASTGEEKPVPPLLVVGKPVKIVAGADWIPLQYDPWVEPGSALDFTGVVPHHEPAGKFGRVLAVGDHFEFEELPGESQRFYGANVCGEANLPRTAEEADRFAANLARIGYNTLRLHHHEKWLVRKDGKLPKDGALEDRALTVGADLRAARFDSAALDLAQMDRFDLLVAACVKHGIYLTTDLYVSRAHVIPWRELGIDRDGPVPADRYKLLCAFYEPAYSNLCAWSRNFLTHVNPYTGRSLAEEPALATLALINEGNLGNKGVDALRETPGVQEAWTAWLAEHPEIASSCGAPPQLDSAALQAAQSTAQFPSSLYATDGATPASRLAAAFAIFLADREAALFERLRDFVRNELGCQAPLSSLSAWYDPAQYALARREFDYVDCHFYVDHPQFLDIPWRLPSSCPNANPVLRPAAGAAGVLYARQMDKPLCVTEFNYSGPGRYRGVGGIAAGALGALQGWSGLWRFAWSHSLWGIVSPGGQMGYFDVAGDPLAIAAERAALCLFLRRDLVPLAAEEPVVLSEAKLRDPRNGAPQVSAIGDSDRAWQARLGVVFAGNREPPKAVEPTGLRKQSVAIEGDGTFLIDTPLTAGGLAEGGAHTAGPLRFELQEVRRNGDSSSPHSGTVAPATVWVSSLDGEPIATSRHLLLTHLTDVQNTGIEYADEDRTILLKWGTRPHLMRNGAAQIELALTYDSDALPPTVWRLDSAGRRIAEVPCEIVPPQAASCREGEHAAPHSQALRFTARTDYDPASATYLYEIVRQ